MSIVCRDYNLLFLMNPRTACTAVGEVLCQHLGGEYLPEQPILDADGYIIASRKHATLRQLVATSLLSPDETSSLFKFTCVRNPFDSLVSLYVKKRSKYQPLIEDATSWIHNTRGYIEDMIFCREHSFEEWIVHKYGRRELKRLFRLRRRHPSRKYTEGADFVMRYESLNEDFREVLRRVGANPNITIPQVNKTPDKPLDYRQFYTHKARCVVERVLATELETWHYSF